MKPFAFLMLLVLLAGCSSSNPAAPPSPRRNDRSGGTPPKGWCLSVRQAAFSPDNRFLLLAYEDGGDDGGDSPLADLVPVYDLSTGQKVHTLSRKNLATFRAIPGTAQIIAVNLEWELNIWDMTTAKLVRKVATFPKGTRLQTVSKDGNLAILSWEKHRVLRDEYGNKHVEGGQIDELWDISKGKSVHRWPPTGVISAPLFTPDGKKLFAEYTPDGGNRRESLWDLSTGKEVPLFAKEEDRKEWLYPLAFTPNGKAAISEGWGSQMVLWDCATGKIMQKLDRQPLGRLVAAAFGDDGKRLISAGSNDLTMRCWDTAKGNQIWASDILQNARDEGKPSLGLLVFSPDATRAFTATGAWMEHGAKYLHLRVWDCANGTLLRELPPLPDASGR